MSTKRARDAEDIRRRKLIRLRFKNLIKAVALNRNWLQDAGNEKLSMNVKRNIALLVRTPRQIGLLTLAEKSLIRTHHLLRTVDERKTLVSLMSNLTCFSKIPPKETARLVECIRFMIVTRGRKLINEGGVPLMVYFILAGEVEISKNVYNATSGTLESQIEMISGPGDCVGDVELLERCNRRHTYTAASDVELLYLFEDDFNRVLRQVMEKQWMEKKSAFMALNYFSFFTYAQILAACKLCMLRQFGPLENIYCEDKGQLSYAHFIVSGECMVLQCLEMEVAQRNGNQSFDLVALSRESLSPVFQQMSNTELLKILRNETNSQKTESYDIDHLIDSEDGDKEIIPTKQSLDTKPNNIENHFIDVGSLTFGGIFGIGEKLEHRVIMARTAVQCLMIPRFWLFEREQNPGNVWQRRRFYLNTTIPSRETLYNDFLTTRKWHSFKNAVVQNNLNKTSISNPTQTQDVPVICRLVESDE